MNGPLAGSITSPYWIYLVYGLGALGLWAIGKRLWYGWLIMIPVRLATAATGYLTGASWAVLGAITYLAVDLVFVRVWRNRQRADAEAAKRFVRLVGKQYAEGKRAAIEELLQLSRDVDQLIGKTSDVGGDGSLLKEYVRREQERQDNERWELDQL